MRDCTAAGPDGLLDLKLTGELQDGTPILGEDVVWIVSQAEKGKPGR